MTTALFRKLNLKDQAEIFVLNAPQSFEAELDRLEGVAVKRKLAGASRVAFVLAFVTRKPEIDSLAKTIGKLAKGDPIVWFAYPKGTSKRYRCDINRDTGWGALGSAGFEGCRMVAIDEDWSGLRFRRAEFITRR